jgi:hypothetical protein
MRDIGNALTLPRDTIQGYDPSSEDIVNFAMTVGAGGVGASAVVKPEADLGMFLGRKAKGADTQKLAQAMSMESQGLPREEVWSQTGWWKKPDGAWAWELADDDLSINPEIMDALKFIGGGNVSIPAKKAISHPPLFEQYPRREPTANELFHSESGTFDQIPYGIDDPTRDMVDTVSLGLDPTGRTHGSADTQGGRLTMVLGQDAKPREILAHELQHFVQDKEGWKGRGSNPEYTQQFIEKLDRLEPKEYNQFKEVTTHIGFALRKANVLRQKIDGMNPSDPIEAAELRSMKTELAGWEDDLVELEPKYKKLSENPRVKAYAKAREDFEKFFSTDAYQMYRREEGEALANLTAQRLSLTPEEREMVPPWLMYGSPDPIFKEHQIPFEDELWAGQDPYNFLRSTEMNLDKAKKEQ